MKTIISFVDDKRQYTNNWFNNGIVTAANNNQDVAQRLGHLLHISGGQFELSKCDSYCISWSFTPEGLSILKDNITHNIQITSLATNFTCMFKQLPIASPFKCIGINTSPLGNQKK